MSLFLTASLVAQAQEPRFDPEGQRQKMEKSVREAREDPASEESEENVKAREEWFFLQRAYPYDLIPAGARAAAVREIKATEARLSQARKDRPSLLSATRWTSVGPSNTGGRIRAIAIDPTDSRTIYVGAAAGGVWKTTDLGNTWSTTFDHQSALAMGALAIDPLNHLTIYAGTGEDMPNSTSYTGDGMFKSTDGGASWAQSGLTQVGAFCKVVVNPKHGNIVYAGGSRGGGGFYRSTDFGATWTRTYSGDVFEVAVNPVNPDSIIIATGAIISRSVDGGQTFTRIATGATGINTGGVDRIGIAYAPSNPRWVYALLSRVDGSVGGEDAEVFKSTDGGDSWTLAKKFGNAGFFRGQGIYDIAIAVHPTNPSIVLALGIDIYRSTSGGTNWTNITRVYDFGWSIESEHPDQHIAVFDPLSPGTVYVGCDGGVYRSGDAGANWSRISADLPITQFYNIDVDQSNQFRLYGGTQDNGSAGSLSSSSSDPRAEWSAIAGGDGFFTPVDQNRPNIVYAENFGGTPIYRINVDNGSVNFIDPPFPDSDPGAWSTPLEISPKDGSTLYCGRHNLWRLPNGQGQWEQLTVPGGAGISAVGLSPLDGRKMAVGKGGSGIYWSTNDGASWTAATGLPGRFVTSVVYDPVKDGRIYATCSGYGAHHIYRSEDNGASFVDISTQLPDLPANSIAIDPANNQHLFVGTDAGVFLSLDGGSTWLPFNEGLPLCPILTVKVHKASRTLYAGTFGRSAFSVPISDPQGDPLVIYPAGGETIVTPVGLVIRWAGFDKPVRVLISYDGGKTFDTIAVDVAASSATLPLGVERSDNVVVRVEETSTGRTASSGTFSLTASANTQEITGRGFLAEALAVRHDTLWATVRGSDTIYCMKLPFLTAKSAVVRRGIAGTVRDLAYDAANDRFFALVADADYGNPHIIGMDVRGNATGEIPAPASRISGIEMTPAGLATMTPGADGKVIVIDPATGAVISQSDPLDHPSGADRRSLTWDGVGLMQGVVDATPTSSISSELQRFVMSAQPRVSKSARLVRSTGGTLQLFGLAYGSSSTDGTSKTYFLTDTAGRIYQISIPDTSAVSGVRAAGDVGTTASTQLEEIIPQPLRDQGTLRVSAPREEAVTIDLWRADGARIARIFEGRVDAGTSELPFSLKEVSSGVYYMTLTTADGERSARPVCVVR